MTEPTHKIILRPLLGLMSGRSDEEIEGHVAREVLKHRRLREEAVLIEAKRDAEVDAVAADVLDHAYVAAMIAVHAQQTVVSTLLDILGYTPRLPKPGQN